MIRTSLRASPPALRPAGVAMHAPRRGFTMIELMVVIAVAAVMTALAAPSMVKVIASNRVQGEASSFVSDLMYARSEAIKRGRGMSLCASSNGKSCLTTNSWNSGWIVYSDDSQCTTVPTTDITTRVARVRAGFKGSDTLAPTAPAAATTTSCLSFNRDGLAVNLAATKVMFALRTSSPSSDSTRCVSIELAGHVTTQTTTSDSSCTNS